MSCVLLKSYSFPIFFSNSISYSRTRSEAFMFVAFAIATKEFRLG